MTRGAAMPLRLNEQGRGSFNREGIAKVIGSRARVRARAVGPRAFSTLSTAKNAFGATSLSKRRL